MLGGEKGRQTRERRKGQEARTFELKLDKSKVSEGRLNTLRRLFLEAKWFTNYVIAKGITNLKSHADYKVNNEFQDREICVLSSQMRQAIIKRLQNNVRGLAKLKEKGMKVGKIRFRKSVHYLFDAVRRNVQD